jgi:galactokinase
MKDINIKRFGELMNQSSDSLKDDYEVTGKIYDCPFRNISEKNGLKPDFYQPEIGNGAGRIE